MIKNLILFSLLICFIGCLQNDLAEKDEVQFPQLSGPYLGQTPPNTEPQLFAPGIVSTGMYNRDVAMTPDGNEIYFCISTLGYNLIFFSKQVDGFWTEPEIAPFISNDAYMYYEPHITPDGKQLLFLSNMPSEERKEGNEDIWAVKRIGDGWGKPYNLGDPICTEHAEYFPSVTNDATLYFSRQNKNERINYIYRSAFINGKYEAPEKLGPEVNCGTNRYNTYIDPNERYIIVPAVGMKDSYGGADYYIVFRDENDQWSKPINMGRQVNTKSGQEYSPYVSPDGKYFFFMSARTLPGIASSDEKITYRKLKELQDRPQNGNSDIYWIDASFIKDLKPSAESLH
jgi:hypothetical protein